MQKHRGFPSRLPGTDFQFTIRHGAKGGATRIILRERYADRRPADRRADEGFMAALWAHFGDAPFVRGNLDAGRLSWLFGREVVPAQEPFNPQDYDALLKINLAKARAAFPAVFATATDDDADFDDDEEDDDAEEDDDDDDRDGAEE